VPHELVSQVEASVDAAFAEHGYAQPDLFAVVPSAGAYRDE